VNPHLIKADELLTLEGDNLQAAQEQLGLVLAQVG
jgi:hypothetical protein